MAAPEYRQVEVIPWTHAAAYFLRQHASGEHAAIVGQTGSGKTTLGLSLCQLLASREDPRTKRPANVTIFGYKPRDRTLSRLGWPIVTEWPPGYGKEHNIVWPKYGDPETAARRQSVAFAKVMRAIFSEGHHTLYLDEVAKFEEPPPEGFGLKRLVGEYWTAARSMDINLIGSTQRPREVGRRMWSEPSWVFIFRLRDVDDTKRAGEIAGDKEVVQIVQRLGHHEFLVIHDPSTGAPQRMFVSRIGT